MSTAQWGIYPWFEQHGTARIHPTDLAAFRAVSPSNKIFLTAGIRGAFLVLTYGRQQFRVAPDLFRPLAISPFAVDTRVRIKGTMIEGEIADIIWLAKEQREIYFVALSGRRHREPFERAALDPLSE